MCIGVHGCVAVCMCVCVCTSVVVLFVCTSVRIRMGSRCAWMGASGWMDACK